MDNYNTRYLEFSSHELDYRGPGLYICAGGPIVDIIVSSEKSHGCISTQVNHSVNDISHEEFIRDTRSVSSWFEIHGRRVYSRDQSSSGEGFRRQWSQTI